MSQPAYVVGQINVKDFPEYRDDYVKPVMAQLARIGAELLVGTPRAEALEGQWPGNWTFVIRFESREAAVEWYESSDYAPFKKTRVDGLTTGGNLVLLPGRELQ